MPRRTNEDTVSLAGQLRHLVGKDRVLEAGDTVTRDATGSGTTIHGLVAPLEVRPADTHQLSQVLALAHAEKIGVCVAGGGSKIQWGSPPKRFDLLLRTGGFRSTCTIDADDLTMTVAAGVTLAEARAQAFAVNRVLPLDGGRPSVATIGGTLAAGDQGAREAGWGRVRDLVLGLRAILPDGTPVAFGGRTMKNVAGYDMTKLFVGSFGTLGVITEATLRLLPRPDAQRLLALPLSSLAQARQLAAKIVGSGLQPLVLEVISPGLTEILDSPPSLQRRAGRDLYLLLAGFAGHPAAVTRSLADVTAWSRSSDVTTLEDPEAEAVFEFLAEHNAATGAHGSDGPLLTARAFAPIGLVWELAESAEPLACEADLRLAYRMGAARGTLDLWVYPKPEGGPSQEALAAWVAGLRAGASQLGGQLALTGGAALASAGLDPWGELGPAVRLMQRLKERFDPHCVLNPGRFVGGI